MSDDQASSPSNTPEDGLRLPWSRSERAVPRRVIRPLQSFLDTEIASASLLVAAAAVALVWANSPWQEGYVRLWGTELGLRLGGLSVLEDLRHWVNDGLMALFFLVVSLEIKRELLTGELRDRRTAILPVAGALGGMLVPALVYLAVTAGTPATDGWGIAMPTDIALALGVLAFALPRAPSSLRVLLLSLAIVDDLGTIVVVVIAYSQEVVVASLVIALAIAIAVYVLQRIHVQASIVYVGLGVGMWFALLDSGVSPTLAGVAMGFLTPAVAFQRPRAVSGAAHRIADETVDDPTPPDADAGQWMELARLSRSAVSPLAHLESVLHPWTSFVVVPLFALANAGITLGGGELANADSVRAFVGVVLGRVLGKPLGIALACLLAVRLGLARLPAGIDLRRVVAIGAAAGVPFTVSLFIAELSLPDRRLLEAATLGVAVAAVVAGAVGFVLLRRGAPREPGA